jgi:hypothetical protein
LDGESSSRFSLRGAKSADDQSHYNRGVVVIIPTASIWQLLDCEQIVTGNAGLLGQDHLPIGITRLRNEALVLPDTLSYIGNEVDAIVAYDDASTDRTLDILRAHPKVALIVANGSWEEDIKARRLAEGRHRGLLLEIARAQFHFSVSCRVTWVERP